MITDTTTAFAAAVPAAGPAPSLPVLVARAAEALANATTAAEVLEAGEIASFAYDVAKRQARLAKAKNAHDTLIAATHRAQADALEIEAQAKRRLADEYDAAQERGEVAKHGQKRADVPNGNISDDLGISRRDIHEARQIRDAEQAEPGIVQRTLQACIVEGAEPTRAVLRKAVGGRAKKKRKRGMPHQIPPRMVAPAITEEPTTSAWQPPAEVRTMVAALRDEPKAFRDLLRGMLDLESHYKVADLLVEVLSHRRYFAQDVANAVLDRVLWAERDKKDDTEAAEVARLMREARA